MTGTLSTPAISLLGCEFPVVLAGMGGVARSELVSAVTAAGGFGFLGMVREVPALIVQEVARVRAAGHQNFGVNIIPAATEPGLLRQQVDACIALAVPVVSLFWDVDEDVIGRLRRCGTRVVHQVGSIGAAKAAVRAGAQMIIAQGVEAGGHVWGDQPLWQLLPAIVDAVDVPVLAAGGLSSGADLLAALAFGGQGIVVGTAFIATSESFAHDEHKRRIVAARTGDTVLTRAFHINWPANAKVRVLESPVTRGERGDPFATEPILIGKDNERPIYRFSTDSPLRSSTGALSEMALYAGIGVGRIAEILTAEDRLASTIAEAKDLLPPIALSDGGKRSPASPVCYVGELGGRYMGFMDDIEVANLLANHRHQLRRQLVATPGDGRLAGWILALDRLLVRLPQTDAPAVTPPPELATAIPRIEPEWLREAVVALNNFLGDREPEGRELARNPDRIRSSNDGSARVE